MSRAQELINVLSEEAVIAREAVAKAHGLCKICGKPAMGFRTQRAEVEYSISAICESCQDYFFATEH
jgi:hypothetical protein